MVLLSCSGTGGAIYAKLAKRNDSIQLRSGFLPAIHRCCHLLCVVNKRSIAETRFVTRSRLLGKPFPRTVILIFDCSKNGPKSRIGEPKPLFGRTDER